MPIFSKWRTNPYGSAPLNLSNVRLEHAFIYRQGHPL